MFLFINLIFAALLSSAQSGYLGAHIGATDATGPFADKEVQFSFGGRGGWIFYDHIGLGVFTHYYRSQQLRAQVAYVPILAELTYYPAKTPYDPNTFYASALFGTTHMIISDASGKNTENATTFGAIVGYSVFLQPRYNLGPEVQYFWVFGDDSFIYWSAQLSLKILF